MKSNSNHLKFWTLAPILVIAIALGDWTKTAIEDSRSKNTAFVAGLLVSGVIGTILVLIAYRIDEKRKTQTHIDDKGEK